MKAVRCPKCRNAGEIILNEFWRDHCIQFIQGDDGKFESPEGYTSEGMPYCVEAICCGCRHQWRLRGVKQITDLPNCPQRELCNG